MGASTLELGGGSALLPCYADPMPATEKISVAMGRDELRLAKTAAEEEGISLSAFVTKAVRDCLEEKRRMEAANEVLSTFVGDDFPTPEEERELLALWSRPRAKPALRRTTRKRTPGGAKQR
jgi:hypothetical protein